MVMRAKIDEVIPRGKLMGQVRSAATELPLASATIELQTVAGPGTGQAMELQHVVQSDANGNFEFRSVPIGNYYAFATLPGYASPASLFSRTALTGGHPRLNAPRHVLEETLPTVTVSQHSAATIDFALEAGGSISGRVTWQNGSPAQLNQMSLMVVDEDASGRHFRELKVGVATDLKGNFRIGDLFSGKYLVGARVPRFLPYLRHNPEPAKGPEFLNCFSSYFWTGEKAYFMDAVPVEVETGIDLAGIDLTLPMMEHE